MANSRGSKRRAALGDINANASPLKGGSTPKRTPSKSQMPPLSGVFSHLQRELNGTDPLIVNAQWVPTGTTFDPRQSTPAALSEPTRCTAPRESEALQRAVLAAKLLLLLGLSISVASSLFAAPEGPDLAGLEDLSTASSPAPERTSELPTAPPAMVGTLDGPLGLPLGSSAREMPPMVPELGAAVYRETGVARWSDTGVGVVKTSRVALVRQTSVALPRRQVRRPQPSPSHLTLSGPSTDRPIQG
jgi:hypothetical protein